MTERGNIGGRVILLNDVTPDELSQIKSMLGDEIDITLVGNEASIKLTSDNMSIVEVALEISDATGIKIPIPRKMLDRKFFSPISFFNLNKLPISRQ